MTAKSTSTSATTKPSARRKQNSTAVYHCPNTK